MLEVRSRSSSWAPEALPLPSDANTTLGGSVYMVTCTASSTCVAVGGYTDKSGNQPHMILVGSGTSWTTIKAPILATGIEEGLEAVACGSPSACVITGNYLDGNNAGPLLVTGSGTSWAASKPPLPSDAATSIGNLDLLSVACPDATTCIAVGWYPNKSGAASGLLLTGNP
jgi:hypothetical protein